jgi:hypothetical protein
MRNFLSARDLLAWQDEGYVIGAPGGNGQYLPGKAARWRAGRQMIEMLGEMEELEKKEIINGVADPGMERENGEEKIMVSACRDRVREEEEEERDILYGRGDQHEQQDQEEEEERSTLYGRIPDQSPLITPSLRQYRDDLALLERLGIDPPTRRPRFQGYVWEHGRTAA